MNEWMAYSIFCLWKKLGLKSDSVTKHTQPIGLKSPLMDDKNTKSLYIISAQLLHYILIITNIMP